VALVKKTYTQKIKIYLFHAAKRAEVVHLLLHKEVMKRMALYMEEYIVIKKPYGYTANFADLFAMVAAPCLDQKSNQGYVDQVLHGLLTKKERDLVYLLFELHSVTHVAEQVGFSRSYVSQLLLSAAHKLGLSQIAELLSMDKTNGVLLKMGETSVERYC
jgi:DNA-binding CsgD family transcriptional regulator